MILIFVVLVACGAVAPVAASDHLMSVWCLGTAILVVVATVEWMRDRRKKRLADK